MDRLIELKNGANYTNLEKDNTQSITVEEAKISVFNNKIDDIFNDIDNVIEINKEIETMTSNHQYNIEKQVNISKSLFIKLISRIKDVTSKANCQYQLNIVNLCKKKLADVSKSNDDIIRKNSLSHRNHFKLFDSTLDDKRINKMIDNGEKIEDLIRKQIMTGKSSEEVDLETGKVNDKYNDIIALEANIASLHQLFLDLAVITQTQGEFLDNISLSIEHSGEYIDKGNSDLVKSIDYMKSIREKQCWIFLFIIVVIGIIIAVCVATIKG